MPTVFISYRREDSAGYAGRLHEELEERLDASQIFRDVDTLRAGQDFESAIRERLAQCQVCLVMIGPGWLRSQTPDGRRRLDQPGDYVSMEIAAALARPEVLVIPVLVGGAAMPPADALPEAIRSLARKHAFTTRDETWEADMDRLVSAMGGRPVQEEPTPGSQRVRLRPPLRRDPPYRVYASIIIGILLLAIVALYLWRGTPRTDIATGTSSTTGTGDAPRTDRVADTGAAYAIDVPPSTGEVAHGDLIFTVLSGSVQRRGDGMRVWLRIRASNEGYDNANFWDDSFRLVIGGQPLAPSSGLNEVLEHRSIRQGVIRFDAPMSATGATLRVTYGGKSAELPLDLTSSGRPPVHDEQDPRDALSHAVLTAVVRNETPLLTTGDVSTVILRVNRRAFVNTQRITLVVRWANMSRYPAATVEPTLRLEAGGAVLAPVKAPSEAVERDSTYVGDVVFEVPPSVRTATLRASANGAEVNRMLTLY